MKNKQGHLAALVTVVIWGTTFISTKLLLAELAPLSILVIRFVIGYAALMIVCPHRLRGVTVRQEAAFAAAGLCGICLYYLLENVALTYTLASNVGVIISVAPFFTALLSHVIKRESEPLRAGFFVGFAIAMTGIALISFGGSRLEINLKGDLLALLAAAVWACYSVLTRKIAGFGYPTLLTTRHIFFYGLLFMAPAALLMNAEIRLDTILAHPAHVWHLLYLGVGASALCFVTWNSAVKLLGAVKTSVYIYMVPAITVTASALVLRERITVIAIAGTVLTLTGLFLSEKESFRKRRP